MTTGDNIKQRLNIATMKDSKGLYRKEQSYFVGLYRLYNHLRQIKLKEGPMQGKRTILLFVMLSTMLLLCIPTWAPCQDQATPLDVKALLGSWQLVRV